MPSVFSSYSAKPGMSCFWRPQIPSLRARYLAGGDVDRLAAHLDLGLGMGLQVEVPVRVVRAAGLRREDRERGADGLVGEGVHPLGPGLRAAVVKEQQGRALLNAPPTLPSLARNSSMICVLKSAGPDTVLPFRRVFDPTRPA